MEALLGESSVMQELKAQLRRVAPAHANVVIVGETGVGKEVVARTLHQYSRRADRPLIAIDCGALTDELAAGELFGARAGAYTGATGDRPGLLLAAHGGTLLLDEVGNC